TGVGGVIRDVLGVFAEPIAVTDTLFFGDLNFRYNKLPANIKHPRYLLRGVVSGVGAYGNNMGIPTVNGGIYFDEAYTGYALVFCGCIGLLKNRNYARIGKPGDVLVIAGARTGRDGIHGVNFASEKIEGDTDALRSAVQIPDPIVEQKLMRAVLEIGDRRLASGITDLGGGGLSSGVCEIAKSFGCGAEVDLASVPLKTQVIEPWEIWISESQERMLLVVPEQSLAKTLSIFEREEIEAGAVGKLTDSQEIFLRKRTQDIGRIDLDFLFSPPLPNLKASYSPSNKSSPATSRRKIGNPNLTEDLLSLLQMPNIASKEEFVRTYDFEVKGNTILKPLQYPDSGPNDAAVLKPLISSEKGVAISCGYNPRFGAIDTYWMAASSIDEAIRNNIAVGGRRIALLDNFAWGNPEVPKNLGSLVQAARACYDISKAFETPFISGKDSLYNQTPLGEILPTLLITALGIVPDVSNCMSSDFKVPGDSVYLTGKTLSELGGSEYYSLKKVDGGVVPRLDLKMTPTLYKAMNRATDQLFVRAVHDISQGGMAVSLAEMCIAQGFGVDVTLPILDSELSIIDQLYSESNSRFLVEIQKGEESKFEKIMKGFACSKIGTVTTGGIRLFDQAGKPLIAASTEDCVLSWKSCFSTPAIHS
ncbi:MAG TPA: phosphoribosylformylglycinamidine synthase subunit PurL, partial [Nitrososphaerales archaeon]|nr:phosphoribosylformylglycinamidine synthase subunit PurL [Nitrososphaerales archaeon]